MLESLRYRVMRPVADRMVHRNEGVLSRVSRHLNAYGKAEFVPRGETLMRLTRVRKAGAGVIVEGRGVHPVLGEGIAANKGDRLAYYPKIEHAGLFLQSMPVEHELSTALMFPGSVGVLYLEREPGTQGTGFRIPFIQGSFKIGRPKEFTAEFARPYGAWRRHLIEEAFVRVQNAGGESVTLTSWMRKTHLPDGGVKEVPAGKENAVDFRAIAAAHGYEVQEVASRTDARLKDLVARLTRK